MAYLIIWNSEVIKKKSEQVFTICNSCEQITYLINTVIIGTLGCEADIDFWLQIRDYALDVINDTEVYSTNIKSLQDSLDDRMKNASKLHNDTDYVLLPDHLKKAAQTIGLDLTEVKPSPGPIDI